jgi:hypothetical protein
MPIPRDRRVHYPADWRGLSLWVRFGRAGGRCEHCARPHGQRVACLPDGRWYDPQRRDWRGPDGAPAPWPDIAEHARLRHVTVRLAACHRNHDPRDNRAENLLALCRRCHLIHDRPYHLVRRRLRVLQRRARGDLFLGRYPTTPGWPELRFLATPPSPHAR